MENNNRLTHGRISVYNLNYHIIWTTKYRNKVLSDNVEKVLKGSLLAIADKYSFHIEHLEVGENDHVHLLVSAPPKISVTTLLQYLKGESARILFLKCPELQTFYWEKKDGIFGLLVILYKVLVQLTKMLLLNILMIKNINYHNTFNFWKEVKFMLQHTTIKLRIYPTDIQQKQLSQMLGNVRFIKNYMIHYQELAYAYCKGHLSYFTMNKLVTLLKKQKDHSWLNLSESTSLQQACKDVDIAFKRFFKHLARYPRFHKKTWIQTMRMLNVSNNIEQLNKDHLKLPKLGNMKMQTYNTIKGTIKAATIKITSQGHYYVMLRVVKGFNCKPKTNKAIGIDLGLRNFANFSNGLKIRSIKYKQLNHELRIWQRKLARRTTNAKIQNAQDENYNKTAIILKHITKWQYHKKVQEARKRVAKLHAKKANQRKDFLQKLSTLLVNQYDIIVLEDLKVRNMIKNHKLAKAIGEQGWRMFIDLIKYKCKYYGKKMILINPQNTTQTCSNCNYVMGSDQRSEKLDLGVKHWECPNCGLAHDRDINAAQNILNLGSNNN